MTIPGTITLDDAHQERWDAVIIGAGPAGSIAARSLAQRSLKTLLIDRKEFPRHKVCGSCIGHRAISLLDHAGLTTGLNELPASPLNQVEIRTPSRSLSVELPAGLVISRNDFDEMLLKEAIDAGAQFLPKTSALVQPRKEAGDGSARFVELSDGQGTFVAARASAIVAADGLGHPSLRHCPEFADKIHRHSRVGLGATIPGDAAGFEFGRVMMCVGKSGYVGAVRLRTGKLHLAAAVDHTALRSAHQPTELVAQILREAKLPDVPQLNSGDWRGTSPLTRRSATVASRRVFLVGDAAGYVEPFTGEGITWALTTGLSVAAFAEQAAMDSTQLAELNWRKSYRQLIRRRQDCCRTLAWFLRRPRVASVAIGLMSWLPALPRFLVRQMNQPARAAEWDFA